MSHPVWNYLIQAIKRTRSYEKGLDGGLLFLTLTEEYRLQLTKKEYEHNSILIYYFILNMLDRLDRWEDYLSTWGQIRQNTNFTFTYSKRAKEQHKDKIEPFILYEDNNYLYVHFLWMGNYRKKIIERKITKKSEQKLSKNLFHARQEELSEAETQERLDWIIKFANESIKSHSVKFTKF